MLNPDQERVVRHHGKPLLVVAGAGSGKTKTLAHKVEFILEELKIPPENILCITFTNKAAREIKERVSSVTGKELPWTGTFHSVAYRLLRSKIGISFSVADESDTRSILTAIMKSVGIPREDYDKVRSFISRVKEDLKEPASPEMREIFDTYQRTLRENGLMDFSDLLYEIYLHIRKDEMLRESFRKEFRFILVDEYQDTNTVQYEILKLLSGRDVCVVGDPNQCIYEWRFARPDNILRFIEDFDPDIVKLQTNYRSKGYILSLANSILDKARARWKDLIPTLKPVRDMGEKPVVRRFESEREEAIWIGEEIKRLSESFNLKDIAILVRVSFITDVIESTLFRLGIPYRVVGALRFYERPEVKNLLYLLRLLLNPSDEMAAKKVVEVFARGVGERTFERVREHYRGDWIEALRKAGESIPNPRGQSLCELSDLLCKLRDVEYPKALEEAISRTRYLEYLSSKYKGDIQDRVENVRELLRIARESFKEGNTLEDFLSEAMLLSSEEKEEEAVSLMTIHSAKGLEFPVVFLPRLEEEVLPHRSATEDEDELEEERRLFYVAVTRAKEKLYLSYTRAKGRRPSRFLSDIPKSLLNLEHFRKKRSKTTYAVELRPNSRVREGILVSHKVFGVGKVLSVDGERAEVDFQGKIKRIHTSFLEPMG